MKTFKSLCALALFTGLALQAQTAAPGIVLPVFVAASGTFNQTATPRWSGNLVFEYNQPNFGTNWFSSTQLNAVPVKQTVNGRTVYSINLSATQSENYRLYVSDTSAFPKLQISAGGGLGVGFQQTSTGTATSASSTSVNLAAASAIMLQGRIGAVTSRWGWIVNVQGMILPGNASTLVTPEGTAGIVFRLD